MLYMSISALSNRDKMKDALREARDAGLTDIKLTVSNAAMLAECERLQDERIASLPVPDTCEDEPKPQFTYTFKAMYQSVKQARPVAKGFDATKALWVKVFVQITKLGKKYYAEKLNRPYCRTGHWQWMTHYQWVCESAIERFRKYCPTDEALIQRVAHTVHTQLVSLTW